MTEGRDELVEVTAEAMFETAYPGAIWATAPAIAREPFFGLARAIIPIVFERAAKVADEYANAVPVGKLGGEVGGPFVAVCKLLADSIATAIRALAKAPEGE